ncbi:hypothetical protein ACVGVM_05730 [Pseudonocardia bannensis]|nr:hypothetical protein [Pseudonocardia bannensis]
MGDHINGIDPDPDLRLGCRHLRHDVVLVEMAGEPDILTAP